MTSQAKQQRHERDLYELKIKAEREALEMQLQLEENRQKLARVHPSADFLAHTVHHLALLPPEILVDGCAFIFLVCVDIMSILILFRLI